MSKFDNDILAHEYQNLMDIPREPQSKVAESICMSQLNFNKAITDVYGKLFPLVQFYNIAQYFNISIDLLMSSYVTTVLFSTIEICNFLVKLIKDNEDMFTDCELSETVYSAFSQMIGPKQKNNKFKALVFNIYREDFDDCMIELNRQSENIEYVLDRNSHYKPTAINQFINNFINVHDLYKHGTFYEEIYEATFDGLLKKADKDILLQMTKTGASVQVNA